MTAPQLRQADAAESTPPVCSSPGWGDRRRATYLHIGPIPSADVRAYVPIVSAAVGPGARRVYGSYWNRIVARWGERRLDELTPSEIRQMLEHTKTHVVARRNARGGRGAAEHLLAALRCLHRHAEDDGLITTADNPARHPIPR
jgi:hypothetical protein